MRKVPLGGQFSKTEREKKKSEENHRRKQTFLAEVESEWSWMGFKMKEANLI